MATYLETLIAKYEKALSSQRALQAITPLTEVSQHQLLDQNVSIFRNVIEDLTALSLECPSCKGTGGTPLQAGDDCKECNGDGVHWNEILLTQEPEGSTK